MSRVVHIIGAGLAGLSAATALAEHGERVIVYEASSQAGGRCRSYQDATLGLIDNGNHLLLSGNNAAMIYLKRIGAAATLLTSGEPVFNFVDAKSGERIILQVNDRRKSLKLLLKRRDLWNLLLLSALNTEPKTAAKKLIFALLRRTFFKGGKACIPLVAHPLAASLIDPALRYLEARGCDVHFNRRLRGITQADGIISALDFADGVNVPLPSEDRIICAIPAWAAADLLPGISVPDQHRGILNAHFAIAPPKDFPLMLGVLNGTIEWIFSFPDRISITISDADRLMQEDREALALRLWHEIAAITGLGTDLPPWQIVKEKRATFAATAEQNAKRPGAKTAWKNLTLAGDWVQNGLPATMEGAILSGQNAAKLLLANS